ncbi:MAG TPA: Gfo/Idh/MocA family oxidoreductase [Lacipirellulaceae bacterium]|nr:Gfo/Idh/MocA family oxidoreductase [Lacipirellulaceae bacterium]
MIRVGILGMGFMGWIHWLAYQKVGGAKVRAICTRNPKRRAGDWRDIQGNFGPPGEQVDLSGVSTYANLDQLLDDPQVDLVDITLPTSLHADIAVRALEAGKHVLCEKPMALTLPDCERMVAAARRANRLLMVAHVLPFFPEYGWALKVIQSGDYGRVLDAAFRRIISDPTWLKDFWSLELVGGPMLDVHIHDAHFIRMLFGMPQETTTVGRMRDGVPEFWYSQFRFADRELVVEATGGAINQQGRPFTHAFEIHLERATLAFDFAVTGGAAQYLCKPMLLDASGGVQHPELAGGDPVDAFVGELREVTRCVADGKTSEILGAILAQDAIRLCEKQTESLVSGQPVKV